MRSEVIGESAEEGFVGELDRAPEGVAEELLTEVANKGIAAFLQEVATQAVETTDGCSVGERGGGVPPLPEAANGVEGFEGETVGIDAVVTLGTGRIRTVLLDQGADRETYGDLVREGGDILGGLG